MSYATAVEQLNSLGLELAPAMAAGGAAAVRRKFDLAHMRVLAAALGDPQLQFPAVLVAGTNGKGSTAATLASIMTAAGYRTALYTSPHLVRVNERIQVSAGGELRVISNEDFARLYFRVDEEAQRLVETGALPHPPSYFEVLTALAFCYFAEQEVEIAILEVGLGGRLDATNIVEPVLSVITDIALDHMDYLGSTIGEIAREKAGILRANGTLVTLPQHPEANQAIGEAAATLNLRAVSAADYIPPAQQGVERSLDGAQGGGAGFLAANHYWVKVAGEALEVDSPLPGQHQQRNIALAIAATEELRNQNRSKRGMIRNNSGYNIANAAIEEGIRSTRWPGRLELFASCRPQILLDVAHNPAGAWTLRAAIAQLPEARPRTLLFSCLRDKSLTEMARILLPLFDSSVDGSPSRPMDHIIFAPIDSPRAMPVEELMAAAKALDIPATAVESVADALELARRVTPADGLIIATGSVYLVGQLRQLVLPS